MVLTFDDGLHNFHAAAFPLLCRYGLPAPVYLTTHYCDFQKPLLDVAVNYLLWKAEDQTVDLAGLPGRGGTLGPVRIAAGGGRDRLHHALRGATSHLGGAARAQPASLLARGIKP